MSDRWQFGSYIFTINPNKNSENVTYVGDNAIALDGTVVSMPTVTQQQYTLSSTIYQGMPRVLSQVSLQNAIGVESLSGNIYALNNTTKNIDKYNSNFILQSSVAIASSNTGQNYSCFDVEPDGATFLTIENVAGGVYLHTSTSSSKTTQSFTNITGNISGIKYNNNSLWMVTNAGILYNTDMNFNIINQATLPYISPNFDGYKGLSMVGGYLLVSFNSSDMTGVYHIDISNGNIVNAFSLPTYTNIVDVAYDGTNFMFLTKNGSQLIYTNGNTVLVDIYTIQQNIMQNGFLYMVDDMSVTRKVSISNYSIQRQDGFLQMYNIDLTVNKIDRG